MSELSAALGGSAPKHTLKANGKSYPVSLITRGVKVAYEKALYALARERVNGLDETFSEAHKDAMSERLMTAYEDGDFDIMGVRGRKILATPVGISTLMGLLMDVTPDEAIGIFQDNEREVRTVFNTVIRESFPNIKFPEGDDSPPKSPSDPPPG